MKIKVTLDGKTVTYCTDSANPWAGTNIYDSGDVALAIKLDPVQLRRIHTKAKEDAGRSC